MLQITLLVLLAAAGLSSCRASNLGAAALTSETETATMPTLFFHWGSPGSNAALLRAGGYSSSGDHFYDWSTSPQASVNGSVIQLVNRWYEEGGRRDSVGPGVYLASSLGSSQEYGSDLLVFRINDQHGAPLRPLDTTRWPAEGRAPASAGDIAAAAPLFALFRGTSYLDYWYVLFRQPRSAAGEIVSFSPPRTEDAPRLWAEQRRIMGREALLLSLYKTVWILSRGRVDPDTPQGVDAISMKTKSSTLLLERLIFDEAYNFILDALKATDLSDDEQAALDRIVRGFQILLPANDPRVVEFIAL